MARTRGTAKATRPAARPVSGARPEGRPETPTGPILLAELTSPATGELVPGIDLVLIPVGAHEQHGPSLPLATDTISAQVLCGLAGALLRPRVAVAPPIPWGVSWAHLGYPGTITLHEETLISLVEDIVTSLHGSGINRFLLVNTHGGNNAALQVAVERCYMHHGVPVIATVDAYTLIAAAANDELGPQAAGHGGGDETAVILATRPDLVDRSSLGPRDVDERIRQAQQVVRALRGALPVATRRVTSSGATGDPLGATAEAGSAILGRATSELRTVIESLLRLELETFRRA